MPTKTSRVLCEWSTCDDSKTQPLSPEASVTIANTMPMPMISLRALLNLEPIRSPNVLAARPDCNRRGRRSAGRRPPAMPRSAVRGGRRGGGPGRRGWPASCGSGPGAPRAAPRNWRWPITSRSRSVVAVTVAVRGPPSSRASSPKWSPARNVAMTWFLARHAGLAGEDHEALVADLALDDDLAAGLHRQLVGGPGHLGQLSLRERGEQRHGGQLLEVGALGRHDPGA